MIQNIKISIVSPVYRAENIIPQLINRIISSLTNITDSYEIILVEDYSPDNSWAAIEKECLLNEKIKGIKLSRNFGQHYAITAGIANAKGEWVIVMDCDLQDQPEEFEKLYKKALEGYDVVQARREVRNDTFMKRTMSFLFYSVLSYLTGTKHDPAIANYGIYHKKVIDAILLMKESIKYFPTMVKWVGFNKTTIVVQHAERSEGESSYNLKRLLNLATDIILAYSDKPLRLTIKLGLLLSLSAFFVAFVFLVKAVFGEFTSPGFATIIISIWLLSGIIISIIGVVGLYIGKIFEGVKKRPTFIIDKKLND